MKEALAGWVNCNEKGSKGVVLRHKLKASKIRIKNWLVMHKKPEASSKILESQLGLIDSQAAQHGWTEQSRFQRRSLMEELWKVVRKEEQLWRQKSRVVWLKEGDRNTSFFHRMANGRRKTNFIGEMSYEGILCSNQVSIRSSVFRSFSNHFKAENWVRPTMRGGVLKRLSKEEKNSLEERRLLWSWSKSSKDSFFVKAVRSMFQEGSPTAKIIAKGFSTVVGKCDRVEFWSELKWDPRS
ncbi:hypothetical protein Ddye_010487 [Dipteronia dyeriana]|uniref:Uncharacterized protein n=1 Tax=Dipteronia dyeriana TaxID=168575 RepID=A0AAD9XDE1_9ROSI|nr:hypothetical protein Ddye_010487 [Dipteronia dyeriana]